MLQSALSGNPSLVPRSRTQLVNNPSLVPSCVLDRQERRAGQQHAMRPTRSTELMGLPSGRIHCQPAASHLLQVLLLVNQLLLQGLLPAQFSCQGVLLHSAVQQMQLLHKGISRLHHPSAASANHSVASTHSRPCLSCTYILELSHMRANFHMSSLILIREQTPAGRPGATVHWTGSNAIHEGGIAG